MIANIHKMTKEDCANPKYHEWLKTIDRFKGYKTKALSVAMNPNEKGKIFTYGYFADDVAIGVIRAQVIEDAKYLHILDLYVKEGSRRMRIGTDLVRTMIDEHGAGLEVNLNVAETDEDSIKFFKAIGFTDDGEYLDCGGEVIRSMSKNSIHN